MKQLHEVFKTLRVKRGMNQAELADELQVSSSTVSRWEKGLVNIPYEKCKELKQILGMSDEEYLALIANIHRKVAFTQLTLAVYSEDAYGELLMLLKKMGVNKLMIIHGDQFEHGDTDD